MDYNQLKLLYEKILTVSLEIEALINENLYEELLPTVTRRDKLTMQLEEVRESFPNTDEYPCEIKEIMNNLKTIELKNLEKLEQIKDDLRKELEKTSKDTRLISAYAPNIIGSSIIDIRE